MRIAAKFYHLGFGKGISKANLAKTNEKRDWHIYQDYAYHLIGIARKIVCLMMKRAFPFPTLCMLLILLPLICV